MSYELLYQRFLLKDGDKLIPYFIHGSNNCYEVSGKRERSVSNLFNWFKEIDQTDLRTFLGKIYDLISKEDSGFLKGIPKTKTGFINGFYDRIIEKEDFTENGEWLEDRLIRKFRVKRNIKTDYDLIQELKDKPFIEFNKDKIPEIEDKTILGFNQYKNFMAKGRVRKLYPYSENSDYGFFRSKAKRTYLLLYQLKYYKLVD